MNQLPLLDLAKSHFEEPIIEFVDHLLKDGIQAKVSDIHLEPQEDYYRVRHRKDGLLYEIMQIQKHVALRCITRLKVMSHLNISETRLPQDGRIKIKDIHWIDIRINICPMYWGEKIVLRILNSKNLALDITQLGFTEQQQKILIERISKSQGLILITGPTGSGKTSTLYSILQYLNAPHKNILTLEDPIEIQIKNINQVQVHRKMGLDFAILLRAFLRQDPDIIMIGEIRDFETAQIAIQAAQTGHLVLSSLHTNHALETLNRLVTLGCDPTLLSSVLNLILSQRLIRKLCEYCKKMPEHTPQGCAHCHQGYLGRTVIAEFLPLYEKQSIHLFEKIKTIQQLTGFPDYNSLQEHAYLKINEGMTCFDEVNQHL